MRKLPTSLRAAIGFNLIVTMALLPVAGQSYDLAGLTGTAGAWLRWGTPLFGGWKFGTDLSALGVGAQGCAFILDHLGMGGAAALTTAWKLPLVVANIVTAVVLYDIARRLNSRRPTLVPLLWLLSPVPIFVAAGFGSVEPLTVLTFVLATDLVLRRRPIGSGVVIGLGIGFEYLPVLVLVAVVVAVSVRLLSKREATYIGLAALGTTAACFLPLLLTQTGRSGLFAGLGFSADAASAIHNSVGSPRGSSLWLLLGGISPGRYWVIAGAVLCLGIAIALAFYGRRRGGEIERQRCFVAVSAAMLLVVVLTDPGPLPQFSDLVFGSLCLLSLVIIVPAWSLILGPFLQLLVGIVWVYGGTFESFWYDMWATTGNAGWQLPQSATLAAWLGIVGVAAIIIGLVVAIVPPGLGLHITRRMPLLALSIACAGSLFFAVWSAQPAYWAGVGPNGPSVLPGFRSGTALHSLPGPQHPTVHLSTGFPQDPTIAGPSLDSWLSVPVNKRTGSTALVLMGLAYVALIVGGGSLAGAWVLSGVENIDDRLGMEADADGEHPSRRPGPEPARRG